jgi:AraC-like DNA-binding protein
MSQSHIEIKYGDDRDIIGPAQTLLLCMNTVLGLEDAAHGLASASIMPSSSTLSLRIALGCATLETALDSVGRYYGTVSTAVRLNLSTEHDLATLSIHVEASKSEDEIQLEEIYLSWLYMHCTYFLGRAMPVVDVVVRDPLHSNIGRQHFMIGATVRFGTVTSFRFSRSLLGARSTARAGENVHWEAAKLWLNSPQGGMEGRYCTDFVSGKGFVRLKDIAEQRNVSRATMRRRLQSTDGGFRDARERALVEAATGLLLTSDDSVEAISAELGYADARNFRRFLKNATGLTPQQIRLRTASTTSDDEQSVLEKLVTTSARFSQYA